MKKVILIGMIVLLPTCVFGGKKERIKELQTEGVQLQQQSQQYQQALNQINIRLIEIRAIIGELERGKKGAKKDGRKRREDSQD